MNELILSVHNLSVAFRKRKGTPVAVTEQVSFDLHRGEIVALVGESGCGKSLSCLALTRLLPNNATIAAGKIDFYDRSGSVSDLAQLPLRELRKVRGGKIAYVFQEPSVSLNPVFRVGEQIAEVLELHRQEVTDERAEVIQLLRQVGIPAPEQRIDAFPHELSGGMQQRVMIAMALAGNPELLIADEPTTALDVTIQAQILELLETLRNHRGMAVILVTHNLGIVSEVADFVHVMYAGRIVESGPVREILEHPGHPYTQALLAAVPHLGSHSERLQTNPGQVPLPEEYPAGCRFCDRCLRRATLPDDAAKQRCTLPEAAILREIPTAAGHRVACPYATELISGTEK